MEQNKKIEVCDKHADLLHLIKFLGAWAFQSQLKYLALRMNYTSESQYKKALLELEEHDIISKEKWNSNYNIIILRNFALQYLKNDIGGKKTGKIRIPKTREGVMLRVLKNELMIENLKNYQGEFSFEKIKKICIAKDIHNSLFMKNIDTYRYIYSLYKCNENDISKNTLNLLMLNSCHSVYKKIKGLKYNDNKVENIKKLHDKFDNTNMTSLKYCDLTYSLASNNYIERLKIKDKTIIADVNILITSITSISNIECKCKKIDDFLTSLVSYEYNSNIKYRIIVSNKDVEVAMKNNLRKNKSKYQLEIVNLDIDNKYFLNQKFL